MIVLQATCLVIHVNGQPSADTSITYENLIKSYQKLASVYEQCDLIQFGVTDAGKPLHLFVMNKDALFFTEAFQQKSVILIQNGIHAGEPCGIDASLRYATDLLTNDNVPKNVIIAIIPVYNVGGMLNRGCCSRANQNGPQEHGFRGNARNLDLNRDYIKGDSKNVFAFYEIFHWLKPHLFIDTHTSNGADYQYAMTFIATRHERLSKVQGAYLNNTIIPYIFSQFDTLTPYVNVFGGRTPFDGFAAFNDHPRYSTGYASLFNCMGFTTEAHMLKSFEKRVSYTYKFIDVLTQFADNNFNKLIELKREVRPINNGVYTALNLNLDMSKSDSLLFYGYESFKKESDITGQSQLYYNQDKPRVEKVSYYNNFTGADSIKVPETFVIKGAYAEVIHRLKANKVEMKMLTHDTVISGTGNYVTEVSYSKTPYEGHWPLKSLTVKDSLVSMKFAAGDYVIPMAQDGWRYILQTLAPTAEDSFLKWNFFDAILGQKEYFSAYVFEPYAEQMLATDAALQAAYDAKMESDSVFASDGNSRLLWLYHQSEFYEKEHKQLPYIRIY